MHVSRSRLSRQYLTTISSRIWLSRIDFLLDYYYKAKAKINSQTSSSSWPSDDYFKKGTTVHSSLLGACTTQTNEFNLTSTPKNTKRKNENVDKLASGRGTENIVLAKED